jgi:hypothetical protein
MGVKISSPGYSKGVLGSKAASLGLGYATGGLAGAGMGLLQANNPSLGTALGAVSKISGSDGEASSASPYGEDAMNRRFSLYGNQAAPAPALSLYGESEKSPDQQLSEIQAGLDSLTHPDVPQELRDAYAEPLLRTKYSLLGNKRF